jgi:hypothetical protein
MAKNDLSIYLEKLLTQIPNFEKQNDNISKTSIGWHLEHTFKVLIKVTETIKGSDPVEFKSNFNFMRMLIFLTKKIPKGKAKAPKSVSPSSIITTESLLENAALAKQKIKELYALDSNKHFIHPFFGDIKLKDCIKFLRIHTNHHLKIMGEINESISVSI